MHKAGVCHGFTQSLGVGILCSMLHASSVLLVAQALSMTDYHAG